MGRDHGIETMDEDNVETKESPTPEIGHSGTTDPAVIQRAQELVSGQHATTGSDLISDYLTRYALEIISSLFPSPIDGMKLVQRRLLWSHRGNTKPEASVQLVGELLKIHPYGDGSAYDVVCRMAQDWSFNPPLTKFKGLVGSYSGKAPAAMRYTKSSLADITTDIFFDRATDLEAIPKYRGITNAYEPQYLVPVIPTALLYDMLTIGFGYQSRTGSLAFTDLCKLVSDFIIHMDRTPHKEFPVAKHIDRFIPDLPTYCILINAEELKKRYLKGDWNAPILMEGRVILSQNKIVVQSVPHHFAFGDIRDRIEETLTQKNSSTDSMIDRVDSLEVEDSIGGLTIVLKRGNNVFDVWDEVKKIVKHTGSITPIPNYALPNGRIIQIDPINILRNWYAARRAVVLSSKRRELQRKTRDLWIAKALLVVVGNRDRVIEIIKPNTREKASLLLQDEFDLTHLQAEAILGLRLEFLSSITSKELVERKKKIEDDIETVNASFKNTNREMAEAAIKLSQKHKVERHMHVPDYIGYAKVSGGYEQFENVDEAVEIADRFQKGPISFVMYPGKKRHCFVLDTNGKITRYSPEHKYGRGDIYWFDADKVYTVSIEDGAACCVPGFIPSLRDDTRNLFYVSRNAYGFTRSGEIKPIVVNKDLSVRKSICRGSNTDLIYVMSAPDPQASYYVATCYSSDPNTIVIKRIHGSQTRAGFSPLGDIWMTHSYTGKDWFINVPEAFINRLSIRSVLIPNVEALLKDVDMIKLELGSSKVKKNSNIVLIS